MLLSYRSSKKKDWQCSKTQFRLWLTVLYRQSSFPL